MSAPKTCPTCHAPVPASAEQCPRCLMRLGLDLPSSGVAIEAESGAQKPRTRTPPLPIERVAALFPDLEVEALVGQGGMGVVYRARQKSLGRVVALKVLHPDVSSDPAFADRFLREAKALARLAHQNIVAVYDFGERNGAYFLLMEYVDGASLRDLIRTKELAPRQALSIVREICDALQFAHDEGVVHRDIKPENVLVDKKGRVKIADFGLAKLVGVAASDLTLTAPGQVMGTLHYMAPEQMEHPRDVDHRADIYSLGVVFYEMLTGSLPLGRFEPPSHRVQIDVRLDEIVLRSLEREPSRRYQQAVEVKTDVEGVASGAAAPAKARTGGGVLDAVDDAVNQASEDLDEKPYFVFGVTSNVDPSAGAWSLAWFVPAWILAAMLLNHGKLGLAGGMALLFALTYWVLKAWVLRTPELKRALDAESSMRRTLRTAFSFALFSFGFAFLYLAHVSWWERGTYDYEPPPGAVYLARAEPSELETYRALVGEGAFVPARLERANLDGLDGDDFTFVVPPAVHAGWGVFAWTLAALLLVRKKGVARPLVWKPVVSTVGYSLVALALVDALPLWIQRHDEPERVQVSQTAGPLERDVDRLCDEVRRRLVARGFQVYATWRGDTREDAQPGDVQTKPGRWGVLVAHTPDAQERWHPSWTGPVRDTPAWRVTIGPSSAKAGASEIDADLGALIVGDPRIDAWLGTLEEFFSNFPGE